MAPSRRSGLSSTPPYSKSAGMSDRRDDDCITREEALSIAAEAAETGSHKAIKATFALLGVDVDEFESVQDFRGDLQWVKSGRRVSKAIGSKAGSSVVGIASIGIAVAIFDFVKKFFH